MDTRKSARMKEFVPVQVFICGPENDRTETGPFPGTILDISSKGACLLMSRMRIGTGHVYHTPKNTEGVFLRVQVETLPKITPGMCARPVWTDVFESAEFGERLIGIEFLQQQQ